MKKTIFKLTSLFAALTSPLVSQDNSLYLDSGYYPDYPSNAYYDCYPDYANNPYANNYTGIAYEDSISVVRLTSMVIISVAVIAVIAVTLSSSTCKNSH